MFKNLIENYINNMNINDIIMFSRKENIHLEDNEYEKIYSFIKNNRDDLLNNIKIYKFLDTNFSTNKRDEIYNLYLKYQKKYSSYL